MHTSVGPSIPSTHSSIDLCINPSAGTRTCIHTNALLVFVAERGVYVPVPETERSGHRVTRNRVVVSICIYSLVYNMRGYSHEHECVHARDAYCQVPIPTSGIGIVPLIPRMCVCGYLIAHCPASCVHDPGCVRATGWGVRGRVDVARRRKAREHRLTRQRDRQHQTHHHAVLASVFFLAGSVGAPNQGACLTELDAGYG